MGLIEEEEEEEPGYVAWLPLTPINLADLKKNIIKSVTLWLSCNTIIVNEAYV